jgi:peptidoglycan/LPS O-acetylase OafA/YrhL
MKRIPQLDGVRGVAILMVMVWHYFWGQIVAQPGSPLAYSRRAVILTWSGVDLFFVLSGFLIAGILIDHRNTSNYFKVFYVRRLCRIFPLYFLVVVSFAILWNFNFAHSTSFRWLFDDPFPLWSYASFTQNIFMGERGDFGPSWLNVTWSLAVEEQFYLLVPLLIYFLPKRPLVWVLLGAIVAAPVLRHLYPGLRSFVNTPWRSDSLLSGALLAVFVRWHPFVQVVRQRRTLVFSVFFCLLGLASVMVIRPKIFGPFDHSILAALYTVFILIAFTGFEPVCAVLRWPVLIWFGQLSYGIYLFHQPVSGLLHALLRRDEPRIQSFVDAGITMAAFVITMVLAMLSFRYFEGPILQIGHRFRYSPKMADSSPTGSGVYAEDTELKMQK